MYMKLFGLLNYYSFKAFKNAIKNHVILLKKFLNNSDIDISRLIARSTDLCQRHQSF